MNTHDFDYNAEEDVRQRATKREVTRKKIEDRHKKLNLIGGIADVDTLCRVVDVTDPKALVDDARLIGFQALIKVLKAHKRNAEVQIQGLVTLGEIAQQASRRHISSPGASNHFKISKFPDISNSSLSVLGEQGAISTVVEALELHSNNRFLSLRGLWTLEHLLKNAENKLLFGQSGGNQLLNMMLQTHKSDIDISQAVKRINPDIKSCCIVM